MHPSRIGGPRHQLRPPIETGAITESPQRDGALPRPFTPAGVRASATVVRFCDGDETLALWSVAKSPSAIPRLAGNDVIYDRNGNDTILGGAGNDCISAGRGTDHVEGGEGADRLLGGSGADNISGGDGNDSEYGGSGSDFLYGEGGTDRIYCSHGSDYLSGGPGKDTTEDP